MGDTSLRFVQAFNNKRFTLRSKATKGRTRLNNMAVIEVIDKQKNQFNRLATHPLQSWQWGQFRQKNGVEIIRLASGKNNKFTEIIQLSLHPIPHTPWKIGYVPKSVIPSTEMLEQLISIGKSKKCIFIKFEPNIVKGEGTFAQEVPVNGNTYHIIKSSHPLFTKYTFVLDLKKTEEELLSQMHHKTRYNIKVAQKHNVLIAKDDSPQAFEHYLRLTEETTRRQHFFAHDRKYHELMWQTLHTDNMAYLFTATYSHENTSYVLAAWIVFLFNNILYYPYGSSSHLFRNTMASNLLMWEIIKFGKAMKATSFDMWGALGPEPDSRDPWYGFHRFKAGYGSVLTELMGSFDLIITPSAYSFYNASYKLRQLLLSIKSYLK